MYVAVIPRAEALDQKVHGHRAGQESHIQQNVPKSLVRLLNQDLNALPYFEFAKWALKAQSFKNKNLT